MDYKLDVLENGLSVLAVPMPYLDSACVSFWVKTGSRNETRKKGGISHFLEHMAFKGGKKYKNALAVSRALDGLGAEYNAATSKDWTVFYVKVATSNIEKAFDVLSDMLLQPRLADEDIEREKHVILEEIAMEEDQPAEKVGTIFSELIFPNHPLGFDIAGTVDSVKSIKRDDFIRYRSLYYVSENSLLTVSGGIESKKAYELASRYFLTLKKADFPAITPFNQVQKKMRIRCAKKATEQTHIVMGYPAYKISDERRYAQSLLSIILGGGMSSRLFVEVREKRGLAYAVSTSVSMHEDVGVFATYAGVDPGKAREAIKIMISEHERILGSKRIKSDELNKAKEYLKGRVALSLEDTSSVNSFFAKRALFLGRHKIETPEEFFKRVDQVTIAEVEGVAKDLFSRERLNIATIGPVEIEAENIV